MLLGASVSLERALKKGFNAIPLKVIDKSEEDIITLADKCAQAGVSPVQAGGYCNLTSTDEQVRTRNIQLTKQRLMVADRAGIGTIVVGGGHRNPDCPEDIFAVHPDNWTTYALDVLADSCIQVLSDLQLEQATLSVETWVMTPVDSPEAVEYLLKKVAHPRLKICFDPVNLMNLQRYFGNGTFLKECVERFGESIEVVHLKDSLLLPKPFTYHMSEAPIGQGNLDFRALLAACSTLKTNLPFIIEHVQDWDVIQQSADYIRGLANELGIDL